MSTIPIDLDINRSLLNSNFDSYKLCLRELPKIIEHLEIGVDRVTPNPQQYSLLYAKLYGLQNHLIFDNHNRECIYFVDKSLKVQKYYIDPLINQFVNDTVWEIPLHQERKSGCYNVSLKLIDRKYVAVSDGIGNLYILDHSTNAGLWQIVFTGDVIGSEQNFVISDAYKMPNKDEIHLLLLTISPKNDDTQCISILHWITLVNDNNTWNHTVLRQLTIEEYPQYCAFEPNCQAVYIASDLNCQFTLDSENPICQDQTPAIVKKKRFSWTQTATILTISLKLSDNSIENKIKVTTHSNRIEIVYDDQILLEGNLYQCIEPDTTTWTLHENILRVILQKSESGLMWPEVIEGSDHDGEYMVDPSTLEQVRDSLAPLTSDNEDNPPTGITFNSQEVEDCDFESDAVTFFQRICCRTHQITHQTSLGPQSVLLTVKLDADLPPAFGIRHDVDTCIFQPETIGDRFRIKHVGTLHALGYIQASKPQRKFFVCSPDLSYSVICESTKHVFLYYHNKTVSSGELRNRTTGRRVDTIAQQKVISLPTNDEILGIYASNSYLYILGEYFIIAYCI